MRSAFSGSERTMTYVVDERCIKCKTTDCVAVCPVNCFYEGENMLVIHPDECIDCGVSAEEDVTFIRLETGPHHDGVRFANGKQVTLQQLGPDVKGYVIDTLLSPRWSPSLAEVM